MLVFCVSVFLLVLTPGPAVLTLAGIGAAYGYRAGLKFLLGLICAWNIVILAVASGLSSLILTTPLARTFLLAFSIFYISYLAFQIAAAGERLSFRRPGSYPGFKSGLILNLLNPKAYAVTSALFTGFSIYPNDLFIEFAIKISIMNFTWVPLHLFWLHLGRLLNKLNLSLKIQKLLNYLMSFSLILVIIFSVLTL